MNIKMGRYKNNVKLKPGDTEIPVIPSETLEEQNFKWEKEMLEIFKFTRTEIDAFKRIRSRVQFLDYCKMKGIQLDLF